jgi:uncharacterized protein (TIGR03663 family)
VKFTANNKIFIAGFLLLICVGVWLRWRNIEQRPMHGDEANQACQFQILWERGEYKYEPRDYHGPTLYYMTLPLMEILGVDSFEQSEKTHFRTLPLFFALLTALTGLMLVDLVSRKGVLLLTAFQMISPSMVYYSTYYIQESLLVFASTFFVASLWRFYCSRKSRWLVLLGTSLGFMHATKETFIISLFALVVSVTIAFYDQRKILLSKFSFKPALTVLFSGLFVSVLFYSSFFTNPQGPIDSIRSFSSHFGRGLGTQEFPEHMTESTGHVKGWTYYLANIIGYYPRKLSSTLNDMWSNNGARPITEIFFLTLWLLSCVFLKHRKSRLGRAHVFFATNTLILLLVYSFIPYKTPWCAQVIVYSMLVAGAITLVRLLSNSRKSVRVISVLVAVLLAIDLTRQSMLITEQSFSVSHRNQYAYSHAVIDVENLAERIDALSHVSGLGANMPLHFFTGEYWPLPWYLRKFNKIGYWEKRAPSFLLADVPVILTTPDREDVISQLSKTHTGEVRSRIPGYWLQVFYRNDLWNKYMNLEKRKKGQNE